MEHLIDSALWVDSVRPKSPAPLKAQTNEWITHPDAVTCEPVTFEMLRNATLTERAGLARRLATLPLLATPAGIWRSAAVLGQRCRDLGLTVNPLDLLIATVALAHDAEVISFDGDYSLIAQAEPKLRVQILTRTF
jgi:predicted nucleic acid-binding protein